MLVFATQDNALAVTHVYCCMWCTQEPERRQNLWARVQQLGDLLGVAVQSPVIPLVVGDEATALAASAQLLKKGFHVPAIRPPTVPKNTSRSAETHALAC